MKTLIPLLVCGLLALTGGRPAGPPRGSQATGAPMPNPTASPLPVPAVAPYPTGPYPSPLDACTEMDIGVNMDTLVPAVMGVMERISKRADRYYESKVDIDCDDEYDEDDDEEGDENKEYMKLMKDMSYLPSDIIDFIDYTDSDITDSLLEAIEAGLDSDSCDDADCAGEIAWNIVFTMEKHRLSCRTSVVQKILLAILMRATSTIVDVVDDSNLHGVNIDRTMDVLVKTATVLARRIRRTFARPQRTTLRALASTLERRIHSIIENGDDEEDAILAFIEDPLSRAFQCVPEGAMTKRVLWAIEELGELLMQPAEEIVKDLLPRFLPPCDIIGKMVGIENPAFDELAGVVVNGTQHYQFVMFHVFWYLEAALLSGDPPAVVFELSEFLNANETALFEDAISDWDSTRCLDYLSM